MLPPLEFTGERFVPGVSGEIVYEHVHRYAFARRFASGRRVLDAACGEGYGSALLAQVAAEVIGIDVDAETIDHARAAYQAPNLSFTRASITSLPLPDESVDVVVSFETIEHLQSTDQPAMLAEFSRVLRPEGLLIVSSPNRPEYSDRRSYQNPFHVHELDRDELARLLDVGFPASSWFRQRIWLGSMIRSEAPVATVELWEGDHAGVAPHGLNEALYFVVLAAKSQSAIPALSPSLSLLSDRNDTELARHEAQAREAIRLDRLAGERLDMLDRQIGHIQHLERLVAEREALLARDREALSVAQQAKSELQQSLAQSISQSRQALGAAEQAHSQTRHALDDAVQDCNRLERALDAQQRIIAYRQSVRWWLALPIVRARLAWMQWRSR